MLQGLPSIKFASTALLLASSLVTTHAVAETDLCAYNEAEAFALDPWDFEENKDKGWRQFEGVSECAEVAADLIRDYYQSRELTGDAFSFLAWHEGQLRARIGQEDEAITLFKHAYNPGEDIMGWNYYVTATIAFLEEDLDTLKDSREKLAAVPEPEGFYATDRDGNEVEDAWPMHLDEVDSLIECFGRSYAVAYDGNCEI